jgi:hypothetical protein
MRLRHVLLFLSVTLAVLTGCSEDSEKAVAVIEKGDVHGTIRDKETGDPIEGASVDIGGKVALTDKDGKYALKGIPFSDKIDIVVSAANYSEYEETISLGQELLLFDIGLVPVDSPSARILEVLKAFSRDIEALDPDKIPSIQSRLSEDYIAANDPVNDQATIFGVAAGVVPANYDALPDTIMNIIEKYDKLEFKFADPDVEFEGSSASVRMRFEVYAETKPPEPKEWEIVVDGRLDLRKQNGDWKITYWQLIPPFLKFEEKPL